LTLSGLSKVCDLEGFILSIAVWDCESNARGKQDNKEGKWSL